MRAAGQTSIGGIGAGGLVARPGMGLCPPCSINRAGLSAFHRVGTPASSPIYSPAGRFQTNALFASSPVRGAGGAGAPPSAPGGTGGADDEDGGGGIRTSGVELISARSVTAMLDSKFDKGFDYTEGAAERIGTSPGILFELLSLEAAKSLKAGYTKIYLPTGELQVIFQRGQDWGDDAKFYLPSEVANLPTDTPSYTVKHPCPHAREAFTIAEFFDAYHDKMAQSTSEMEFLINAITEYGLYAPSSLLQLYRLFQQPEFADKRSFIDPACGPGSVIFLASLFFSNCTGGDLNARFLSDARDFDISLGDIIPSENGRSFYRGDYLNVDYTPYDIVYLFLDEMKVPDLESRLVSQLRPGSVVVSPGEPKLERIPKVKEFMDFDLYSI